jgi:hypothetical protein
MTMTDPIGTAARAAAQRLTPEYGPGLAADVEAALHAQGSNQRPGQFLDPVSLGSLIVAIATLAWTVYSDVRKKTPDPAPGVVARYVRIELRKRNDTSQQETDLITDIVVNEIAQAARDLH